MTDLIKGLFGGGDKDKEKAVEGATDKATEATDKVAGAAGQISEESKARAQDFISRYSTGDPAEGYSKEEAAEAFRKVAQRASPEQLQRAAQQAVQNMPENERAQFNEMLQQRKAGQGGVDIQRTGATVAAAAGGAAAAGAAGAADDPLGGLLGSLTGGDSSGGGIGGLLGGLLGGGDASPETGAADGGGGNPLGAIGDLMSSPAGKALIGGIAAFAMKEMMDKD